jgi:signal transduction histidine kinase
MDEEGLCKLGTPFYSTKDRGTGLGMGISYQIVKEHHGTIMVESQPGKGTTFIISLPAA